jgi:predicted Zn-dependent protease
VAEAQSRALALSNAQQHSDSQGFQLMRARVEVLTATDPVALQRKFAKRQPQKLDDSVNRYAQALLALRLNQIDLAEEHARQGKAEESDELAWQTLLAEIDSAAGREQKAIARWEALSAVYPHYSAATTELARLLEQTGRTDEAQARLLDYLRGQNAPHPRAWQQLARIRQQTGDPSGSAEALAEYYLGIDAPAEALLQMRRALRLSDAQSAARQRLEARIAQVESDKQREQETATR